MAFSRFTRFQNEDQIELMIDNTIKDKHYKKFYKNLPHAVAKDNFKMVVVLILFAALTSCQNFKGKKIRQKLINAETNFERFEIFRRSFKPTEMDKLDFTAAIKRISFLITDNTESIEDKFVNKILSFFPKMDTSLESNFYDLRVEILSKVKKKIDNVIYDEFSKALNHNIVYFEDKKQFIAKIMEKDYAPSEDQKTDLNNIYEFYCGLSLDLAKKINIFIAFLKIDASDECNNKYIRLIKNFAASCHEFLKLPLNFAELSKSKLSILSNGYSQQENFMIILNFLLNIRVYKNEATNKKSSYKHSELQEQINTVIPVKSLLVLVQECCNDFVDIRKFLHSLVTTEALCDDNFETNVTKFLFDVQSFLNRPYLITLMCGCNDLDFSDVYGVLIKYLISKRI